MCRVRTCICDDVRNCIRMHRSRGGRVLCFSKGSTKGLNLGGDPGLKAFLSAKNE